MAYEIEEGDIAIILKPIVEDGQWTGSIKTGIVFGSSQDDDPGDGMRAALDEAITMAATQQFLDIYPEAWEDFQELRNDLLKEMFPEQFAEAEDELTTTVDGNVITLNRWSKTEGNA